MAKTGRNDPCPCGSGKKYKKCCLVEQQGSVTSLVWQKMRRAEGELIPILMKHAERWYGPEAFAEAWDEFSLWRDVPMNPESELELDTTFIPWFLFHWVPDNGEVEGSEYLPEIPVAMHYLEEKGSQLDSFHRRFIEEAGSQPYSFFVVTDVKPGERLWLRDLLLKREVCVHEQKASTMLRKGSIIFTSVITLDENSIMLGCAPTVISPSYIDGFIDLREDMAEKIPYLDQGFLLNYDIELRGIYYDIREEIYNPAPPQMQNTDGDPLQLTRLHYSLRCSPREALDELATLSLANGADELLDEGEFDEQGDLVSIEFDWLKKGNKQHANWDNTIMGHIHIDGVQLTIDVNSQERAEAIKRKVKRRLGKRAVFRDSAIQSTDKLVEQMETNPPHVGEEPVGSHGETLQDMPEVQEQLKEMAEEHWKAWPDSHLPALHGQTPREAVKTASGKERVEAVLWQMEQDSRSPEVFRPDVEALRKVLGLE